MIRKISITIHILWNIHFFIYNLNLWFTSFLFYLWLLDAFVKQRKATVNFLMSVCLPSVHMKKLGSHWKDFHEIWQLNIFRKICLENSSFIEVFYILLTMHLDVILVNDQLDALFLNVFISCFYMFRATSTHHQEGQIVLIHHLV
jgi:hypothetical protein